LNQTTRLGTSFIALLALLFITGCGAATSKLASNNSATTTNGSGSTASTSTSTSGATTSSGSTPGSTSAPSPAPTPTNPSPTPTPTMVVGNTTLTAETAGNTSIAAGFGGQPTGNEGPSNVSKVDTRSLLYSGSTTKIYAHFMAWFGDPTHQHMDVGYTSSDPNQVKRQVSDAMSRSISGFIEDWYGPNNSMPNATAFALKAEAESRNGGFQFAIMEDAGALTCGNSGCDVTNQVISDLTYAYNNFETSPAYITIGGRPAVFFFDADRYGMLDWQHIAASVPGNPLFIFQNAGGFTHPASSGSFSWVQINGDPNDWAQSYLADFYSTANSNRQDHAFAATFKGFNDKLASWSANRVVNQNCGQTWLSTFSEIGNHYSSASQVESLQIVTWNDYEEATEIETGIDNCVSISASVSASQLSWTVNGNENTIDHYTPYISLDGENLMQLADLPAGTHSVDLAPYHFAAGSYKVFVKAVGKPSLKNHVSASSDYVSSGS
jgi:hypothetical protein